MFYNYCWLKINPFGIKIMRYVNILHTCLARREKIDELFFRLGKIDCIKHFCPMRSQMSSYVNILISIESYWLWPSYRCKYVVSDHSQMQNRALNWYFISVSGKLFISHIIAHWAVKFRAISTYLISIEIYWHRLSLGCKICCVRSLTNAQESLRLVFISPIFHTFSVNSQKPFLSADFCM